MSKPKTAKKSSIKKFSINSVSNSNALNTDTPEEMSVDDIPISTVLSDKEALRLMGLSSYKNAFDECLGHVRNWGVDPVRIELDKIGVYMYTRSGDKVLVRF